MSRIADLDRHIGRIEESLARAGRNDRPVAVLDLEAFDANASDIARRADGMPVRVASKSLRVRALIQRALDHPGFQGVLSYTLAEALWLCEHGIDDIVVAYPTADRAALGRLAEHCRSREQIAIMVDSVAQLELIAGAVAGRLPRGAEVRLVLEADAAYAPVRGLRFGALRSPIATPEAAAGLAREIASREGMRLIGIMAYEGQIAGVGDAGSGPRALAVRTMQALSARELSARRGAIVAAVRDVSDLELVNAGGTGSIERSRAEAAVTEVAAGSGLIGPALFDTYRSFRPEPALWLGFSVVRRPAPRVATLLGGGWIASGVPGADRLPALAHPEGLAYAPMEAAGEVQTPVVGRAADALTVGDTVWMRPAKAGESAEHAPVYELIDDEGTVTSTPTYRGEGTFFL